MAEMSGLAAKLIMNLKIHLIFHHCPCLWVFRKCVLPCYLAVINLPVHFEIDTGVRRLQAALIVLLLLMLRGAFWIQSAVESYTDLNGLKPVSDEW